MSILFRAWILLGWPEDTFGEAVRGLSEGGNEMTKRELIDAMEGMADECTIIIQCDDGVDVAEGMAGSVEYDEGEITIGY